MNTNRVPKRNAKLTQRQRDVLADVVLGRVTFTCHPAGTGAVYYANADAVDRRNVTVTVRALQSKGLVCAVPIHETLHGVRRFPITVVQQTTRQELRWRPRVDHVHTVVVDRFGVEYCTECGS